MATIDTLLTAEEYAELPDLGQPSELVRGRIVMMNVPKPRHGVICVNISYHLRHFIEQHDIGRVMSNDAGVVTERDPDSVRGADVSFCSYARCPKGQLPNGYLNPPPEVVFEVLSPDDRWKEVLAKVAEYLAAGVLVVCVLDDDNTVLHLCCADRPPQKLTEQDDLRLPELHPDFSVPVAKLFE
jgi:Uma2 family endonuclease